MKFAQSIISKVVGLNLLLCQFCFQIISDSKHDRIVIDISKQWNVRTNISQTILPILEDWSSQKLSQTFIIHGIRRYLRGSSMTLHVDTLPRIISAILQVQYLKPREWLNYLKGWAQNRGLFDRMIQIVRIGRFRRFWRFLCKMECKWIQKICKNVQYRKPSRAFS